MRITISQLRRIIKEEVEAVMAPEPTPGSVLDNVYVTWGDAGFTSEKPGLTKSAVAAQVREEYGEGADGYAAFVADYADMLGGGFDEEARADEVADEIYSPKYGVAGADAADDEFDDMYHDCPKCDGQGEVDDEECDYCDGGGHVSKTDAEMYKG